MAQALKDLFNEIASAIHEKDGKSDGIVAKDFPQRIREIPTVGNEIVLQSLNIVTPPNKVEYTYNGYGGAKFDPTGMQLEATLTAFANSLVVPIDLSYVTYEPSGNLTAQDASVTIYFKFSTQTVTAVQPITVSFAGPTWNDIETAESTWTSLESQFNSWDELENYGK